MTDTLEKISRNEKIRNDDLWSYLPTRMFEADEMFGNEDNRGIQISPINLKDARYPGWETTRNWSDWNQVKEITLDNETVDDNSASGVSTSSTVTRNRLCRNLLWVFLVGSFVAAVIAAVGLSIILTFYSNKSENLIYHNEDLDEFLTSTEEAYLTRKFCNLVRTLLRGVEFPVHDGVENCQAMLKLTTGSEDIRIQIHVVPFKGFTLKEKFKQALSDEILIDGSYRVNNTDNYILTNNLTVIGEAYRESDNFVATDVRQRSRDSKWLDEDASTNKTKSFVKISTIPETASTSTTDTSSSVLKTTLSSLKPINNANNLPTYKPTTTFEAEEVTTETVIKDWTTTDSSCDKTTTRSKMSNDFKFRDAAVITTERQFTTTEQPEAPTTTETTFSAPAITTATIPDVTTTDFIYDVTTTDFIYDVTTTDFLPDVTTTDVMLDATTTDSISSTNISEEATTAVADMRTDIGITTVNSVSSEGYIDKNTEVTEKHISQFTESSGSVIESNKSQLFSKNQNIPANDIKASRKPKIVATNLFDTGLIRSTIAPTNDKTGSKQGSGGKSMIVESLMSGGMFKLPFKTNSNFRFLFAPRSNVRTVATVVQKLNSKTVENKETVVDKADEKTATERNANPEDFRAVSASQRAKVPISQKLIDTPRPRIVHVKRHGSNAFAISSKTVG